MTGLQPGLGRDLVGGPTFHIPAVDDVRLALVGLRHACRTTSRAGIPAPAVSRSSEGPGP